MATVNATWALPTVNPVRQRPISRVRVQLSADSGANFADLVEVAADAPQTARITDLEPGDYQFRHIVVDAAGREGAPVVTPFAVDFEAPGVVTDVQVQVTP